MKIFSNSWVLFIPVLFILGCTGNRGTQEAAGRENPLNEPDSIIRGTSGQYIVNEISYKWGKKNGLAKTFYPSGRLRTTKWYVNDLLQDSVMWFYEEGQLFRTTPYRNDTIDGIQKQYYRTGELKAKLGFSKGLRTPFFQEFTKTGKLVTGYPEIIVKAQDNYKTKGVYRLNLELSKQTKNIKFFRGEFYNGVYDTTKIEPIRTKNNIGYLDLKKTKAQKSPYVGVVAEVLTDFGNRLLIYKKIELPYNDLE